VKVARDSVVVPFVLLAILMVDGCAGQKQTQDPAAKSPAVIGTIGVQFDDGPMREWHLSAAYATTGDLGDPALYIEVVEREKSALAEWTAANVGRELTIYVGNRPIIVTKLGGPLSGNGVIEFGGQPVTKEYMEKLAREIAGGQ
jgi:hypothetical protein